MKTVEEMAAVQRDISQKIANGQIARFERHFGVRVARDEHGDVLFRQQPGDQTMPQPMTMAEAFDEWMRKYKEDPAGFLNGMQSAKLHESRTRGDNRASDYGNDCADLLTRLMAVGKAAWDPVPADAEAANATAGV